MNDLEQQARESLDRWFIAARNEIPKDAIPEIMADFAQTIVADYERLKAENEKYVEALEHYASLETWDEADDNVWEYVGDTPLDRPMTVAQQAINTKGGE